MIAKAIFSGIVETSLNQYLSLDEDIEFLLQPLAGKVIAVLIEPFAQTLYLCPATDRIQVLEDFQGEVDVTISGSLPALGIMGLNADSMRSVFSGDVCIEGDTQVGHQFQQLFKKLDVDFEEQLSHVTGDVVAHQVGNVVRAGQDWTQQTLETFRLNVQEFLQEETRDLPATGEADIVFRDIDELRADFDRLEARVERLKNNKNKFQTD